MLSTASAAALEFDYAADPAERISLRSQSTMPRASHESSGRWRLGFRSRKISLEPAGLLLLVPASRPPCA
jgi:hypothetical protein